MLSVVTEKLLVMADPGLYHFINQGCLTVETINDPEEYSIVDVCLLATSISVLDSYRVYVKCGAYTSNTLCD
jgi:hypothetical protein